MAAGGGLLADDADTEHAGAGGDGEHPVAVADNRAGEAAAATAAATPPPAGGLPPFPPLRRWGVGGGGPVAADADAAPAGASGDGEHLSP